MKCRNVCHWTTVIAGMLIGAGACLQSYAHADILAVNWGGDYVEKDEFLEGHDPDKAKNSDKYGDPNGPEDYDPPEINGFNPPINPPLEYLRGRYADEYVSILDPGVPFNPTSGYDLTKPSAIFYGGAVAAWSSTEDNTGFTNLAVKNQGNGGNGGGDAIEIEVKPPGNDKGEVVDYAAVFFWDKKDFLNGLNTKNVPLEYLKLSLSVTQDAGSNPINDPIRWVVRNGTEFFLSSIATAVGPNSDISYDSGLLSLLTWYEYDPRDPLKNIFAELVSSSPTKLASELDDITAIGFYTEWGRGPEGQRDAGGVDMKIKGFKAFVVPEPSFAAVGLFGVAVLTARRLRTRRSLRSAVVEDCSPPIGDPAT